jgi:hypothetical protein
VRIDGDEIWKPGYDGPPPFLRDIEASVTSRRATRSARSRRRWVAVVVGVAGAACAGALVVVSNSSSRTDNSTADVSTQAIPGVGVAAGVDVSESAQALDEAFAGADERRLPEAFDALWQRKLEPSDDMWVEVVGRRDVVVARGLVARGTGAGGSVVTRTTIDVLDAESGKTRSSRTVAVPLRSTAFVASFDDVLVFQIGDLVTAVDAATGNDRWSLDPRSIPPATDIRQLAGTELLALEQGADGAVLLDGRSGVEVGRFAGPVIATDYLGNWYIKRGDDIVKYDLSEGFADPTIVASGVGNDVVSVIDGQAVASGEGGWRTAPTNGEWVPMLRPVSQSDDFPTPASAIDVVAGAAFLASGSGGIAGMELVDDGLEVRWARDGVITMTTPTERGIAAVVATDGGAVQEIVDGVSGEMIALLNMSPGAFDVLRIVGNGVITQRSSSAGLQTTALDLEGRKLWAMPSNSEVAVGDRIMVYPEYAEDGSLVLVAVGDPT